MIPDHNKPDMSEPSYKTDTYILTISSGFIPPVSPGRTNFTTSRLAILSDNSTRPVLSLLAERKFGKWKRTEAFPFWIDGDPHNETLDNVALAQRERRPRRKLNIPPGDEYKNQWKRENRDRAVKYSRELDARKQLRELLDKGKEDDEEEG